MEDYYEFMPEIAEREQTERQAVMMEIALQEGGYDEWVEARLAEAVGAQLNEEIAA